MSKTKKIKEEEKNMDDKKQSLEEETIDRFVLIRDSQADDDSNYTFPLMMRLNRDHMARLDHLANKWKIKRSSLARQMLEEMIYLVMDRYYRDKTPEEYRMI